MGIVLCTIYSSFAVSVALNCDVDARRYDVRLSMLICTISGYSKAFSPGDSRPNAGKARGFRFNKASSNLEIEPHSD